MRPDLPFLAEILAAWPQNLPWDFCLLFVFVFSPQRPTRISSFCLSNPPFHGKDSGNIMANLAWMSAFDGTIAGTMVRGRDKYHLPYGFFNIFFFLKKK